MKTTGFTLIELLVVVSIIGFLVSLVLLNTQDTRFKAHNTRIKELLHQVRNAAELSFNQMGLENYSAVCDGADNTLSNSGEFGLLETSLKDHNKDRGVACFASADKKSFAASSPLNTDSDKSWCVESAGLSIELNCQAINSSKCACP